MKTLQKYIYMTTNDINKIDKELTYDINEIDKRLICYHNKKKFKIVYTISIILFVLILIFIFAIKILLV